MKNNFSDYLIAADGSEVAAGKLKLELWLPWYRGLPLSAVEVAELAVDGVPVSLADAELEVDGKRFALPDLPGLTEVSWFVQDSAWLHVPYSDGVGDARRRAELLVKLYPPYIPMLTWVTRGSATI